jgi:AAA15 family ATPase/GTPase
MLKQLRIKNFKGWKDTGRIRMAPITLFFGANSSGKSSIGQFLMMLKQTIESPDRKAVFHPGGKNSAVQLGSFQEMVYHRDTAKNIEFVYRWSLSETIKIKDPLSAGIIDGNDLDFECSVGVSEKVKNLLQVIEFKYRLFNGDEKSLSIGLSRKEEKREYAVSSEQYSLVRKQGRGWALKDVVRFYGFPDEVVAYYQNADFVQNLNLEQEKLFGSIYYLGPLRNKAERLYAWSGTTPESVGFSGEYTVAAILAARERKISLGYRRPAKLLEEIIALKLVEMGLIEDFKVNPISDIRQEYEVKVRTKGSKDWVDLLDVGFGISQVLPVLVQCFYAPAGSIILMEQPEIHLHPNAQSALADVMIDVIKSRENGADRNIQLIIETHSEHFLRRLQRRIAEDAVPQENVTAYFANIAKTPATLEPLQIDIFGNILNWPEKFFGDDMVDITEQAKAAMRRRMQKSSGNKEESE